MYTITTGGAPSTSSRNSSSRGGFRGGRSSSGPSYSRGGSRGGFSRGGGASGKPFNPKRGFKKDYIDEKLFINKATTATEAEQYVPKHIFADFGIHETLAANLANKGFVQASPIQDQAIPVALTGRDVIGIASTGTGKTAAFLIPLINKLVADNNHKLLILAPTRELAMQIEEAFLDFTRGMKLFSVSCVGGAPISRQIRELQAGVHAVIGTPGRVKDLIEQGKINMKYFDSVVLDEADRMLDMGFVDDMRYILGLMPKTKQSLFFSATFSNEIKSLCKDFLNDPITVTVKSRDTAASVDQDVVRVGSDADKLEKLHEILLKENAGKVLIFREMKRHVDGLAEALVARGFKALALHGDMRNRERERAVHDLTTGRAQIVIATDVAARGIDIADITLVINYDIPNNYETYIHRIGRTGRAGKVGQALTFVSERAQSRSRY